MMKDWWLSGVVLACKNRTMFHVPRISGYLFNCGKNKHTSKTLKTKILSIQHLGPKGTHRPGCPCLPLGFPHLPTAPVSPPRPSAPGPVTPQQGRSPAPHSRPTSWPILGPSPGRCPVPPVPPPVQKKTEHVQIMRGENQLP